jgi:predicted DNA-binding transcriptional regulator AlpA
MATPIHRLPETGELLTDVEAAAFLSVKPRTLILWRHTRGLPHVRITSKVIRYRRADIDEWLARRRVAIVS